MPESWYILEVKLCNQINNWKISVLREFFFLQKVTSSLPVGSKRATDTTSGAGPSKRKHSPIRFSESTSDSKKQSREIYLPPRDQFSKKAATNGSFPDFEYSYGGDYQRGRGRGRRRGRAGGRTWNKRGNRNW